MEKIARHEVKFVFQRIMATQSEISFHTIFYDLRDLFLSFKVSFCIDLGILALYVSYSFEKKFKYSIGFKKFLIILEDIFIVSFLQLK